MILQIQQIFHKIREICQHCYQDSYESVKIPRNYKNISSSFTNDRPVQIPQNIIKEYLMALQSLDQYTQQLKQSKIQYETLQQYLQKQQTQIRKHIGIEQQLRIYSEGIKMQLEQCQKEKIQLLENSKITIKNLKLKNQQLFQEIYSLRTSMEVDSRKEFKNQKKVEKTFQNSRIKTKIKQKSLSSSKDKAQSRLSKIVKTQYIERQKHPFINADIKKKLKYKLQKLKPAQKAHKHHQSNFPIVQPHTSQSKKKHRMDLLQKCKKQKSNSNSKGFDLGAYLEIQQVKRNEGRIMVKKQNSSKKSGEKHHKSSFQQHHDKVKVSHIDDRKKKQKISQQKSKSRSKQSKKKLKSKQKIKPKPVEPKKTYYHNRSLFSVSSNQFRTQKPVHNHSRKEI